MRLGNTWRWLSLMAVLLAALPLPAHALKPAPGADPSPTEIEAVLGARTSVERTGAGTYVIDGEKADLNQLLTVILPQKEETLRTMHDNIASRLAIGSQAAGGMSIETKRAQCQKLPFNSIDRTRCYQELSAMRDQQTQSVEDARDARKDDEDQEARLQTEIDGIDRFQEQYGVK